MNLIMRSLSIRGKTKDQQKPKTLLRKNKKQLQSPIKINKEPLTSNLLNSFRKTLNMKNNRNSKMKRSS